MAGVVEGVRKGIRVEDDAHRDPPLGRVRRLAPGVGAAVQERVADYLERMTDVRPGERSTSSSRRSMAVTRLTGLTKLTLETAPSVCHECVWWQARGRRREVDKERWMDRVSRRSSARSGPSTTATTGGRSACSSTGPAPLFPRAYELPGGPPSDDAMLITCAYIVDESTPVGAAVALPRGDRRGTRPGRLVGRGVRLPLPGG